MNAYKFILIYMKTQQTNTTNQHISTFQHHNNIIRSRIIRKTKYGFIH
jgi:hypothetical protein